MTNSAEFLQNKNAAFVGTQWGDEGKGKGSNATNAQMCGRGQGSNNAGHTFVIDGVEINTHLLPSMIDNPEVECVIGHGTYLEPVGLLDEIHEAEKHGIEISPKNLMIGILCQVTTPKHIALDELRESGENKRGSTKSGVAFVASDMMLHEGIRGIDLLHKSNKYLFDLAYNGLRSWIVTEHFEDHAETRQIETSKEEAETSAKRFVNAVEYLRPYLIDSVAHVQASLARGQHITMEGAQAFGLDYRRGTYPNVTSSDTLISGLASGIGLNMKQVDVALGVAKAFQTIVGGDTMVTLERDPEKIRILRGKKGSIDGEYGKRTGRPRDPGYLDLVMLKAATVANGLDGIILNKLDVLNRCTWGEGIPVAVAYELDGQEITHIPADIDDIRRCKPIYKYFGTIGDIFGETRYKNLPINLKKMVEFCEEYVGVPFVMLGTGPEHDQVILRENLAT